MIDQIAFHPCVHAIVDKNQIMWTVKKWGTQDIASTAFPIAITYGDPTFPGWGAVASINCSVVATEPTHNYLVQITQAGAVQFTVDLIQLGAPPMVAITVRVNWIAIGK